VGLGTPAYMSPEQVIGDKLDHRSDIFSLGIVMYQMVAGQKPFVEDDERSAIQKIRLDTPPSPRSLNPNVHKELERIILRCMEKTPDHRYASTQDLVITLEQYLAKTVRHNYRARLLLYLREQNLLTDDETSATLHPAFIGDYLESHPRQLYRRRWRWLFLSIIFLLIAIILGILNLVQLPANFKWKKRLATPQICAQNVAEQKNYGYLRVLVHPWAQVEIDGKIAATTPFDQPLTLKTGKHVVRLINRYFETVRQEVEIKKDQVHSIVIALQRKAPGKVEP
jgi:serine/threonine-protein kinase